MSLSTSRHLTLAALASLLLAASLVPLPAAAAGSSPGADSGPRPRVMRQAGAALEWGTPPAPLETRASTATSSTCPAPAPTSGPRPKREVFGFVQAGAFCSDRGYQTYNYSALTTIAYFGLHVNAADGTIVTSSTDTGWRVWQTPDVDSMVQVAHQSGVRAVLSVIYQDDSAGMCTALSHASTTVAGIVGQVRARGLDGVNVDYEGVNQKCGTTDARSLLRGLVQQFRTALGPAANLTVDTYAGSALDSLGFFDIPGLAPAVDQFFVMAYDLDNSNWSHPPLSCSRYCLSPNSPLSGYYWNDTRIVSEYASTAGPGKVLLGLPTYGYTACVAAATENAYPAATPNWVTPTYADSVSTASDPTYAPFAAHRDSHDGSDRWDSFHSSAFNCTRESYWNDATSLAAKYDLVNSSGIAGAGVFSLDYAGGDPDFWSGLVSHFTLRPGAPPLLATCPGASSVQVGWTAPASAGGAITSYTVAASPGGATRTVPGTVTEIAFDGLQPGTAYTFTVSAANSYGPGPVSAPTAPVTPSAAAESYAGWFNWYDRASPGMAVDNVHLVNPGSAAVNACVILPGVAVAAVSVPPGGERYQAFDPGSIGGPVRVLGDGRLIASQRVAYYQSFNEVAARTSADAATSQYFNWYDNASPGMSADNIHLVNPGSAAATVSVSLPGAAPLAFTLAPGQESFGAFPAGTIGGPVSVTSSGPVLASQRVTFNQSFNEVPATPAGKASTSLFFNWYDSASAGMSVDNVHLVNPGPGTATGTVSLPGASPLRFSIGPGQETYLSFPAGTIGGPVAVTTGSPVIASQRVSFFGSFNEVAGRSAAEAAPQAWFNWYDHASPGMNADNVHLLNPGGGTATGTISLPGATPISFSLAAGAEGYYSFPSGTVNGPVTVFASAPVLASQRVAYFQSFNEVSGQN